MVHLFTLVCKTFLFSCILFDLMYLDVFSRRYIKSLELLHDCDETEGNQPRHSITSCPLRKSSQIEMNINSENSQDLDEKKAS